VSFPKLESLQLRDDPVNKIHYGHFTFNPPPVDINKLHMSRLTPDIMEQIDALKAQQAEYAASLDAGLASNNNATPANVPNVPVPMHTYIGPADFTMAPNSNVVHDVIWSFVHPAIDVQTMTTSFITPEMMQKLEEAATRLNKTNLLEELQDIKKWKEKEVEHGVLMYPQLTRILKNMENGRLMIDRSDESVPGPKITWHTIKYGKDLLSDNTAEKTSTGPPSIRVYTTSNNNESHTEQPSASFSTAERAFGMKESKLQSGLIRPQEVYNATSQYVKPTEEELADLVEFKHHPQFGLPGRVPDKDTDTEEQKAATAHYNQINETLSNHVIEQLEQARARNVKHFQDVINQGKPGLMSVDAPLRGALIVLEGPDKAGKTTMCNMLRDAVEGCVLFHLPDRSTVTGKVIDRVLKKELKEDEKMDKKELRLLFAANAMGVNARIVEQINMGKTVIVDRHVYSNVAYGTATGETDVEWLYNTYETMMRPDLVIILEVDAEIGNKRGQSAGVELYEVSDVQTKVQQAYKRMREHLPKQQWLTVSANNSVENVFKCVLSIVNEYKDLYRKTPISYIHRSNYRNIPHLPRRLCLTGENHRVAGMLKEFVSEQFGYNIIPLWLNNTKHHPLCESSQCKIVYSKVGKQERYHMSVILAEGGGILNFSVCSLDEQSLDIQKRNLVFALQSYTIMFDSAMEERNKAAPGVMYTFE